MVDTMTIDDAMKQLRREELVLIVINGLQNYLSEAVLARTVLTV